MLMDIQMINIVKILMIYVRNGHQMDNVMIQILFDIFVQFLVELIQILQLVQIIIHHLHQNQIIGDKYHPQFVIIQIYQQNILIHHYILNNLKILH